MSALRTAFSPLSTLSNRSLLRQTLLLGSAIFLLLAPELDAQVIAEMSANFIVG